MYETVDNSIVTAVFVALITREQDEDQVKEYLDELQFLALTAGVEGEKRFTQRLDHPHPRTYIGSGKLQEIKDYVRAHEIDYVLFDDELSPSQMRNIEREINFKWPDHHCSVVDRTGLILDIFADRAQTAYAKTQVELAQYQYLYPRLTGMWTHLERQRGGKGGLNMRGPGESQLETDRRIVLEKITRLKEQLTKIDRQMASQRSNRGQMVRISLVGYTNVGKSTIMNLLAKSDVFAENKLFATLDTTVRKVVIENLPFLLADTVGFIRKLPSDLVESFKSTLDEVREADLLVHVVDISHPDFEDQIRVVENTLQELGCADTPAMIVFNKIDAYTWVPKEEDDLTPETKENITLEELKRTWMAKMERQGDKETGSSGHYLECLFISAREKENIDELREVLYKRVRELHVQKYPYNDFLYQDYE